VSVSIAALILYRAECGMLPTRDEIGEVPQQQFALYFSELSAICPDRRELSVQRRPGNALNVEIGAPLPRCLLRSPDGRGLAWLASGGDVLAYGTCDRAACPHAGGTP